MTYRNIHIQVNTLNFFCPSAKSLSFNWFVEIVVKKYCTFSPNIGGEEKDQSPFPVIEVHIFSVKFLLECVEDLEEQLAEVGSKLHFIRSLMDFSFIFTICIKALRICALTNLYFLRCCRGNPVDVFRKLSKKVKIEKLCFDQELK